ncbi:site-specific integrase [Vibrio sp. Makdt]|uniref:site-specific integrase n=1 Tax=Vibrio sp. Makdt TaxID=2998828 RepID=UPI0022CD8E02|nr:site-specific integrase [Vibrio sp. Makdt]MDA0151585.1 site-specific integrase [Vibrio sp. Makdt]
MMKIERAFISYQHEKRTISHHVMLLHYNDKVIMLSAINLFLKSRAHKSQKTSERYSSAIKRFFEFMINYKQVESSNFWREVTEPDIREWQGHLVTQRDSLNKTRPKDETIFSEACIVFDFYSWANSNNFPVLTSPSSSAWKFNFRDESNLLKSISILSGSNAEYANIDIGRERGRSSRSHNTDKNVTIMSNENIQNLLRQYDDVVYPVMFLLGLATGMRAQGICSVPYIGYGVNDHVRTYPEIKNTIPKHSDGTIAKTFSYTVTEKGSKTRTLQVNLAAWKVICKTYLPVYFERRKLLTLRHKNIDPNTIFFINKKGDPVTPKMIADRTLAAKRKLKDDTFTWSFHSTRDWYATMFVIKHLSKEKIESAHYDAAVETSLRKQIGHSDIRTTYMHYVRVASILLATQSGELDFSLGMDEDFWSQVSVN